MEKALKKTLKELCEPITKIKGVIGILVYGSAVKKAQKGHDIDILVIFNDAQFEEAERKKLELYIDFITTKAQQQELILHFQPPKPITLLWRLISKAEPWIISALRRSVIIYDSTDFLALIKKLLKEGKIYSVDEKVERMMARAIEKLIGVRETLLKSAYPLLECMTRAGQIMLSYLNIFPTSANQTRDMLTKYKEKLGLSEHFIEEYDELIKINEKIFAGTLSEFRASEIDAWKKKIKLFIAESEAILVKLEEEIAKKELREIYDAVMSLCTKALAFKTARVPQSDREKIELFRKFFIETRLLKPAYYETLKELYDYIKEKKKLTKPIDKIYLKTLETAINEVLVKK
ncbi:MAG: nucleotidyltransferase domain-containing protein [Candidatus Pacearchaeota archaeon]